MDKRFFLALFLTGIVLVVTPLLMPTPPRTAVPAAAVGTPAAAAPSAGTAPASVVPMPGAVPTAQAASASGARSAAPIPVESVTVVAAGARLTLSSLGAAPTGATLPAYKSLGRTSGPVALSAPGAPMLRYRVLAGADTIRLDQATYRMTTAASGRTTTVTFTSDDPTHPATITYHADSAAAVTRVDISAGNAGARAYLLLDLPGAFVSHEADTLDDIRHLSYAAKPVAKGASGVAFSSVDPGERKIVAGPLSWAVAKTKYFMVGVLSPTDSLPFAELQVVGGARDSKLATRATGTIVVPLTAAGTASFDLYAGPQAWDRMRAMGREFETANPYGGFMQGVVQPFATIVMRIMLWLKRVVQLDYGWVLVIFGLTIRIVLWPLNQSAMRSSLRLQRIQPELTAVQERYKNDQTKLQQEIMRVYQSHGMSPFSALSGCLPALIPMPVFFALFFVFQNTIEFRGVPFLWLPDISLRDPLYVLPIVTGASMFLLSWIGMRNMPKNPQATMMLYLMPGMFTMFLLSTASGLSIYYLVQQIAAIPQQWLIANERRKATAGG
jgi:YidC/Oxa1 family membrane protein insertase